MKVIVKETGKNPQMFNVATGKDLDQAITERLGSDWSLTFDDGENRADLRDKTTLKIIGYVLLLDGRFRFPETEGESCFLEGEYQI